MAGIRTGVDTGRLSSAVARPGIDTRVWLTLAVVKDVGFDPDEGTFVDVQYQPTGDLETCLLGAPYAGGGFGAYFPVKVDDTVLVAVPGGDTGNGPVIVARMWCAADKPAPDFGSGQEPSSDVFLKVEPGNALKVSTDGANVEIEAAVATLKALADLVELANSPAPEAFVRGTSFAAALNVLLTAMNTYLTAHGAWVAAVAVQVPSLLPASLVFGTAITALAGVVTAFAGRLVPGDLLSTKVKGD